MESATRLLSRIGPRRLSEAIALARRLARRESRYLYLVGGCVRDLLLGIPLADLDLAIQGDPAGFSRKLAEALRGEATPTTRFGTCTIHGPGGTRIDLAMARAESYPFPSALPEVRPAPIGIDLLRRDFTVNSLAIGLSGPDEEELLDPSGGGGDARRRLLRLHHAGSLTDDPTRAFRGARYAARLRFRMAPGWSGALERSRRRGAWRRLSGQRVLNELTLLLGEGRRSVALDRVARWKLLPLLFPRFRWSPAMRGSLVQLGRERENPEAEDLLLCAILARGVGPASRGRFLARLGLAGRKAGRAARAASAPERASSLLRIAPDPRAVEDLAGLGETERRMIGWFSPRASRRTIRGLLARWEKSEPVLDGTALVKLGVHPGPEIGRLLAAIRAARMAGRISSRRGEIELVRRWTAGLESAGRNTP